jgi:hypothetical protein
VFLAAPEKRRTKLWADSHSCLEEKTSESSTFFFRILIAILVLDEMDTPNNRKRKRQTVSLAEKS